MAVICALGEKLHRQEVCIPSGLVIAKRTGTEQKRDAHVHTWINTYWAPHGADVVWGTGHGTRFFPPPCGWNIWWWAPGRGGSRHPGLWSSCPGRVGGREACPDTHIPAISLQATVVCPSSWLVIWPLHLFLSTPVRLGTLLVSPSHLGVKPEHCGITQRTVYPSRPFSSAPISSSPPARDPQGTWNDLEFQGYIVFLLFVSPSAFGAGRASSSPLRQLYPHCRSQFRSVPVSQKCKCHPGLFPMPPLFIF